MSIPGKSSKISDNLMYPKSSICFWLNTMVVAGASFNFSEILEAVIISILINSSSDMLNI